jgi:hypothetical protein
MRSVQGLLMPLPQDFFPHPDGFLPHSGGIPQLETMNWSFLSGYEYKKLVYPTIYPTRWQWP